MDALDNALRMLALAVDALIIRDYCPGSFGCDHPDSDWDCEDCIMAALARADPDKD